MSYSYKKRKKCARLERKSKRNGRVRVGVQKETWKPFCCDHLTRVLEGNNARERDENHSLPFKTFIFTMKCLPLHHSMTQYLVENNIQMFDRLGDSPVFSPMDEEIWINEKKALHLWCSIILLFREGEEEWIFDKEVCQNQCCSFSFYKL